MTSFYLAVVPARAGSKRIPGKNLTRLAGKALIDYTLEAARRSTRLGAVTVSTDSDEIARHARTHGAVVPALRPAGIAADRSPMVDAVLHALRTYERASDRCVDAVVLLQPTSPLRTAAHIDAAIELFEGSDADTVTSVRVARDHPYWVWREQGTRIVPFFTFAKMSSVRHDLPVVWMENGAVYVVRRTCLDAGSLYGESIVPFPMDERASIDVDTPLDLEWAEFLLRRHRSAGESER